MTRHSLLELASIFWATYGHLMVLLLYNPLGKHRRYAVRSLSWSPAWRV